MMDVLEGLGEEELLARWERAKHKVALDGFTFMLDPYQFRPTPTDWLPRLIPWEHWERVSAGVEQRLSALNTFLAELYNGQQGVVPSDVINTARYYHPDLQGVHPRKDAYIHIYGVDLVHLGDGEYVVLEDNLRVPSGIAYQMKCLEIVADALPELVQAYRISPYEVGSTYLELFASLCDTDTPACVLLTDSKYGSAFFEHRYLSELMNIPLVEGSDLYVGPNGRVWGRTMDQDFEVDVIYRRVEDLELFVPGLTDAYRQGEVALVNALGTGAADDKLVFLWVPDMIRAYLGEDPILPQAKSYDVRSASNRRMVVQRINELVLKTRDGYGGLGTFIIPDMDPAYHTRLTQHLVEQPDAFIAQETLDFSKHLVMDEERRSFREAYVDLRVYAVRDGNGKITVFPGGLTRVALPGSRITNNSSGGLCKPTWAVM
jgi:uncharacterized circularly permuted ATP-grasp superfamily protein